MVCGIAHGARNEKANLNITWTTWLLRAMAVLAAVSILLVRYGTRHWAVATQALLAELEAIRLEPVVRRYDARELDGLPAPVQCYFRAVLKVCQPMVAAVTIEQTGTMNLSQRGAWWRPFTA